MKFVMLNLVAHIVIIGLWSVTETTEQFKYFQQSTRVCPYAPKKKRT